MMSFALMDRGWSGFERDGRCDKAGLGMDVTVELGVAAFHSLMIHVPEPGSAHAYTISPGV